MRIHWQFGIHIIHCTDDTPPPSFYDMHASRPSSRGAPPLPRCPCRRCCASLPPNISSLPGQLASYVQPPANFSDRRTLSVIPVQATLRRELSVLSFRPFWGWNQNLPLLRHARPPQFTCWDDASCWQHTQAYQAHVAHRPCSDGRAVLLRIFATRHPSTCPSHKHPASRTVERQHRACTAPPTLRSGLGGI